MNQKVIVFGVDGLIPELVYKFSEEGYLPNITRMFQEGSSSKLLPYISTWGDVNWVSFMTGQTPGNCWEGQRNPPENNNHLIKLMDQQEKKCALVHFPETLSTEGTKHVSFAPFQGDNPFFEISSPTVYSTHPNKWYSRTKTEFLGWPPDASLAYHEKQNIKPLLKTETTNKFQISMQTRLNIAFQVVITLLDDKKIRIELPNEQFIETETDQWSDWITIPFNNELEGITRFKLLKCNPEQKEIDLLQSQCNFISGFSNDSKVDRLLTERCGPFISKWTIQADPDQLYYESAFEEAEYQADWLAKASQILLNEENFDLFATVYRLNDETHHTCLGLVDPASPFYTPEKSSLYEKTIRKSYEILDKVVGDLLDYKDEDTLLVLASDHGDVPNAYLCDVYRRLEECNLAKLDENGKPIWNKTKAYLKNERGGLEIYVNLKGREKHGIVEPNKYETVQNAIFNALSTWYYETPEYKLNVAGLVLKKQDAPIIGYWGSKMGDVIFAYNNGFVWGRNLKGDVVSPVSSPGANHGPQIPTAKTKYSSNYGIVLFHGSTTKAGYKRDCEQFGPYMMNDVGVTIGETLGLKQTELLDGKFMNDLV
ncbi:hypothetical protein D7Z54_09880 [Salibacterium salarium]|uniref:Type I phosphodiesterase / nucleotide pyrophosphatase n=1 Tax=Salibacterium salarium TaxID=284579 RepID=A0A3R9P640_9BACI|nr:alkaline phosphatase family protein [Salibacterium salarium]RSL33610.1 hypothetical protein D7Z54_09880 [Salibacterium salarium]